MFTTGPNETLPVRDSVTITWLLVNSNGPAAVSHPSYMGTYMKTDEIYNYFPVYRMVNDSEVIFVNSDGRWSMWYNEPHPWEASLKHKQNNPTPPVPSPSGWQYVDSDGPRPVYYLTVTANGRN